ncbi:23S rRNA pseudouridine(2604) synthase RluF [Saccharibacillus sp. CPCC 101409]|uniref:23S rRNA pseudouridine(2604) synthase RluF n=1 Tax=Saccharibacillus sp. CPCC 101409 TaxID=3058041 RepID=UPI002672719C|nr:23S rRNA pseudouridine(2604) synthase RluF [Saccharibacillus sp. CPCC 101409]MDO3410008.1 23S rRNA pseudouridine(2604) synthase RluF [Saccharibacillus sp. CPCC 101409]
MRYGKQRTFFESERCAYNLRINKYIAESGFTSRRGADKIIAEGKVTINGVKADLGSQVEPGDDVRVSGKRIKEKAAQENVYIALNKPVGITSTTERSVKGNIVDFVGHSQRIFHVGRLDKDSEGLILLTNDGDIVNEILRAENRHEKEYIVTVDRPITPEFLKKMAAGVEILDTKTLPCEVEQLSKFVFQITLTQGLNRQIRRMCEALGYNVRALKRIRIMNIYLNSLPTGKWRDLTAKELDRLFKDLDYTPRQL